MRITAKLIDATTTALNLLLKFEHPADAVLSTFFRDNKLLGQNERGFIAETNATHVFIVARGLLRTPRLVACPEGITRSTVLELCRMHAVAHEEIDLTLAQAYCADEMFCTGTMGELAAVTMVDGRQIGDGQPGPVTQRLSALFRELTAREGTVVAQAPTQA